MEKAFRKCHSCPGASLLHKHICCALTAASIDALLVWISLVFITCCSIFDGQPVPARFSPYLFKFLLDLQPNLHDFEAFDPVRVTYISSRVLLGGT
jgi:hypothetical protein